MKAIVHISTSCVYTFLPCRITDTYKKEGGMPRFNVWVSQLRTLDVVVEAETAYEAEAQVRARLRDSPHSQAWLDSATVMRSVIDDAAPNAAPRRDIATFPPTQQLLNTTDAGKYLSISRTKVYELINSGALESVAIGRSRRVSVAQLQRFLESRT
jgi:excisionase family DNA binding protein